MVGGMGVLQFLYIPILKLDIAGMEMKERLFRRGKGIVPQAIIDFCASGNAVKMSKYNGLSMASS